MSVRERKVMDDAAGRIDLSGQGGALTASVLEQVRELLRVRDTYVHLVLSHNALSDEAVAVLCAILKDRPLLESLDLQRCDVRDKVFGLYITPALLAHKTVRRLDLRKNSALTDASAASLCALVRDGNVEQLLLQGTLLTRVGGACLVATMETNGTLERCELPFTVGFRLIDRAARLTRRNVRYKHLLAHAAERQALPALPPPTTITTAAATAAVAGCALTTRGCVSTSAPSSQRHTATNTAANTTPAAPLSRPVESAEERRQREELLALVDGKEAQEQRALLCYRAHHGRRRAVYGAHVSHVNDDDDEDEDDEHGGSSSSYNNNGVVMGSRYRRHGHGGRGCSVDTPSARTCGSSNTIDDAHNDGTLTTATTTNMSTPMTLPALRAYDVRGDTNDSDSSAVIGDGALQRASPWLDPVLRMSVLHLHVMHERLRMCEEWHNARRQRLRRERGLGTPACATTPRLPHVVST